jgi:hypothetical protein
LLACLISAIGYTQDYSNIQFIENKGQWDKKVLYMADVPAGAIYIENDGVTIVQHDTKDWAQIYEAVHGHEAGNDNKVLRAAADRINLKSHAYKVNFLNAAANPKVVADKAVVTYNNYFIGNDPSKWVTGAKMYLGITVKDIYPNIDLRYYSQSGQVKYDLIVKPGLIFRE